MNRFTFLIAGLIALIAVVPVSAATNSPPLHLSDAIAAQRRLVEESPQDANLANDLGNLLYLEGEYQSAEDEYRRSLNLEPDLASAHYNLALLLHHTGRPRKAEQHLQRVVKLDPQHAWGHYQLGIVRAERGRRSSAIKSYARAMRLDSRLTDPAVNPHIVENSLASSAVVFAYSDLSPAALAPRAYQNPNRVTDLLVNAADQRPAPMEPMTKKQRRAERKAKKAERAKKKNDL